MDDEAVISGDETTGGEQSAPVEYITDADEGQWETIGDLPRESGEEAEESAEPGSTEEAPASTEEEQQLEEELKAVPKEGLVKHLRGVAAGALKGKKDAEARLTELETELQSAQTVPFRPTMPVEDFVANGEAKKFWDSIAKEHPGYYTPLVDDILRAHLNPERIAANPASIPPVVFDVFGQQWLPDFIQKTFGMDMTAFGSLIDKHRDGTLYQPQSVQTPQAVVEKFGLNPETDAELIAELQEKDALKFRLGQLESTLTKLQEGQQGSTKQQEEAAASQRLSEFDNMITTDRQRLLDLATKALPRNADGTIKQGFEHLPTKIARLAKVELDEDADYGAKRGHAQKWFKQPGSVDTAKTLAGGDLKAIFAKHQAVITRIAQEELRPFVDLIKANSQIEQTQRSRQVVKGGVNPNIPASVPRRLPPNASLADRARANR